MPMSATRQRRLPASRSLLVACALAALPYAAPSAQEPDAARWARQAQGVTITRDDWGIAHVRGRTDADAVFGMIYAQAEDDFRRVERNYINAMGRLAEVEGEAELYRDLRMKLFIDPADLQAQYKQSPAWLKKHLNTGLPWSERAWHAGETMSCSVPTRLRLADGSGLSCAAGTRLRLGSDPAETATLAVQTLTQALAVDPAAWLWITDKPQREWPKPLPMPAVWPPACRAPAATRPDRRDRRARRSRSQGRQRSSKEPFVPWHRCR